MEYAKAELEQMLAMVKEKLATQAPYFDARLMEKERMLEKVLKNLEKGE